jgi:YidC/Oxa1 family membrane protein insertase
MIHLLAVHIPVLSPIFDGLKTVMKHVLNFFHGNLGLAWAWSIVATTVVVRIILVPLVIRQLHSMQSLQQHAPEMKRIQQKFKHDKQKQQAELMAFYKENKINPAASCLPMLLQIPVFLSLYYTLRGFGTNFLCLTPATNGSTTAAKAACQTIVDHTNLSFLHFIPSIADKTTSHWGGYVLLVIYVGSQMASGLFMAPTAQKQQRIIFMVMPLLFVFVIAHFPAGLVLYWVTTNLWTVGQGLITRQLVKKTPAPAAEKRSSRTPAKEDDDASSNGSSPEPGSSSSSRETIAAPRQVRRKKSSGRRR